MANGAQSAETPENWPAVLAPPPGPPAAFSTVDSLVEAAQPGPKSFARPRGVAFGVDLDACELDERERPVGRWRVRGCHLSRSNLVVRSRRMCYVGTKVLLVVHAIDDRPVALCGRVRTCEYDADGLYKLDLDLMPIPEAAEITAWLEDGGTRLRPARA